MYRARTDIFLDGDFTCFSFMCGKYPSSLTLTLFYSSECEMHLLRLAQDTLIFENTTDLGKHTAIQSLPPQIRYLQGDQGPPEAKQASGGVESLWGKPSNTPGE